MPRIPLYNQGLGPRVPTATGSLSPRASSAVFEQPGLAQAQLGEAIQNVSKVAADFEIARQDAEVDEIADQYSNTIKDSYRKLNSQETTSIDEYRDAEQTLRSGFMSGVDSMEKLGSRQKQALKNKVNKYADLFSSQGEEAAFTRFLGKASKTANERGDSMLQDAVTATLPIEVAVAEYEEHYNRSTSRGYSMSRTPDQFRFDLTSERVNIFALDETKTLDQVEAEKEKILRGEEEYSGLDLSSEREPLANRLSDQIKFLENESVVAASESFANNMVSLEKSTAPGFRSSITENAKKSIQAMKNLRMPGRAAQMQQTLGITLGILNARDKLRFESQEVVNSYLAELNDASRSLLKTAPGTPEASRAEAVYRKAVEIMSARQQEIDEDPAKYVNGAFSAVYGKIPTPEQSLQRQIQMGLDDSKINLLTNEQAKQAAVSIRDAEGPEEVRGLLQFSNKKTRPYYFRQLRSAGVGLAEMYMLSGPITPTTEQLFKATRPEAIKIQVTPVARQNVRAIVLRDEAVINHMKSMLGGGYADFENREIRGATSDTRPYGKARDEHIAMLTNLAIFLVQEDAQLLTGDTKLTLEQIKPYAEAATEILKEKFSYIATFPNMNTSLRIPLHRTVDATRIELGLRENVDKLQVGDIFFESNEANQVGTPAFEAEKEQYFNEVKDGYGWIAENDSNTAILVDQSGGVVFRDDNGFPVPIQVNFDRAIRDSGSRQREAEDINALINDLNNQRQQLFASQINALELSKLGGRGTPEYEAALKRNEERTTQIKALAVEINRLQRRQSDLKR
tara:strand:+ start:516 stop:2903 length:2388 start_codon:yes stop_codon:yes gene_type:complete